MPDRSRKPRAPSEDPIKTARRVFDQFLEIADPAPPKNPAAVALGKLGGLKGGKARAKALTPKQLSASAQKAAKARWGKKRRAKKK
jgi:hypothetical protein